MARLTGVSQPHIHNVLKGVRNLSPEIADRLLKLVNLNMLDLSSTEELDFRVRAAQRLVLVDLPIIGSPVGSSDPWRPDATAKGRVVLPVPVQCVDSRLAAVRMQADPNMQGVLGESDLAVVNTSEEALSPIEPAALYVVRRGQGTAIRHIRRGASCLYFATTDVLDSFAKFSGPGGNYCSNVLGNAVQLPAASAIARGGYLENPSSTLV